MELERALVYYQMALKLSSCHHQVQVPESNQKRHLRVSSQIWIHQN